jgi:transcription initiation factor TFIIIB Brf1 subunit/transcription initiation factor TFIIB
MSNENIDLLWKEFDSANTLNVKQIKSVIKNDQCTNCLGEKLGYVDNNYVCMECGLIIDEDRINTNCSFDTLQQTVSVKCSKPNSRLSKMQEWYMWTNEEKNTYKLKVYVRNLCVKLNIVECLVENICNIVNMVMDSIKRNDGTKRARVKDGIIVSCINYVSKDTSTPYSYITMAKTLNLDIKYITRADKLILELINCKKLNMNKSLILDTMKPYDYVINTIQKYNIKIDNKVLSDVKTVIEICEDNDVLLDHTPLSIGVCCFYYILQLRNIEIDLKVFSDLYDLSVVTVVKTYNKLKIHDKRIQNLLL